MTLDIFALRAPPNMINLPEGQVPEFPDIMMESLDDPSSDPDLDLDLSFLDF
jgi:hypothetical protein